MDSYTTIKADASDEFTEKRSRFIGYIHPADSEEEALAFVAQIKKKHHDAKHNVYAYVLNDGKLKYSEDGEPQGTAGVPVLSVLQKANVTNCVLVVTRYFGGILLGAGGLTRAYTHAATLALEAADKITYCSHKTVRLTCDYASYGFIEPLLSSLGTVLSSDFGEQIFLKAALLPEDIGPVSEKLTEYSAGKLSLEIGEEIFLEKRKK